MTNEQTQQGDDRQPLLTAIELAAIFEVAPDTIRIWARTERIPAYRIGNRLRFDPSEVKEALKPSTDEFAQTAASRRARRIGYPRGLGYRV